MAQNAKDSIRLMITFYDWRETLFSSSLKSFRIYKLCAWDWQLDYTHLTYHFAASKNGRVYSSQLLLLRIIALVALCGLRNHLTKILGPWQNGRHFTKSSVSIKEYLISIEISLKLVPSCPITDTPALIQIMAAEQAITWTNDGLVHRRKCVSGFNKF